MREEKITELAQLLYQAELEKTAIPKLTVSHERNLTVADAYRIQEALVKLKQEDGHQRVAPKLGLTSKAKMEQMNVSAPIYGYVFDNMLVADGSSFSYGDYIQARVEPEISIVLKEDLKGPAVTKEDVMAKIDYVCSSLEILDSRYENYQFTLPDVIADNTSARGAVISQHAYAANQVDLPNERVTLTINGKVVAEGSGAAVLDHPAEAIAFLSNELAKKGESVKAGQAIMTGGMTQAVAVKPGDVIEAIYDTLAPIKIEVIH